MFKELFFFFTMKLDICYLFLPQTLNVLGYGLTHSTF